MRLLEASKIGACKVTATGRNDGAGSQAEARMSAICFAHAYGLEYIHTPFTAIEHAETEMGAWVEQCEAYFNLGHAARRADTLNVVPLETASRQRGQRPADEVIASHHYLHWCRQHPDAWERARPHLRRIYSARKPDTTVEPLTVAVHVRRGDRYTTASVHMPALRFLTALLAEHSVDFQVCVHSQGDASTFRDFGQFDSRLCLDKPALTTHQQLVAADILLLSTGAFSYTAGVLSAGIVLSGPQKYGTLPSWLTRGAGGQFGVDQLRRSVNSLLRRRADTRSASEAPTAEVRAREPR